jgi:hypothetical protein
MCYKIECDDRKERGQEASCVPTSEHSIKDPPSYIVPLAF